MITTGTSSRAIGRRAARTALLVGLALCLGAGCAQDVRSLGMGGTTIPYSSGGNPAFAALPGQGEVSVPLPLGAINLLSRPSLDPASQQFDLLTLVDQLTHLDTYVFNLARSPQEVTIRVSEQGGVPVVSMDLSGGSGMRVESGSTVRGAQDFEIPLSFDAGPVVVGLRPFASLRGRLEPQSGFDRLFGEGTSEASASARAWGEAGIALGVAYATTIQLPADSGVEQIYVGARAEPFLGLARLDSEGHFSIEAFEDENGDPDYRYEYETEAFYTLVGRGIGFGLRADLGVAVGVPTPDGRVVAGLAFEDLGFSVWNGTESTFAGSDEGETGEGSGSREASRTYLFDAFGMEVNVAFEPDLEALGVPQLASLLVAADGSFKSGLLAAHLGAEAGFGAGSVLLLARAGAGYEDGVVFGVGGGLQTAGVAFDLALHGYRSPFTTNQAVGASLGLRLGF